MDKGFDKKVVSSGIGKTDGSNTAEEKPGKKSWSSAALMETEERNVGAVSLQVYKKYLQCAGGLFWVPVIGCFLLLNEAGNGNGFFLLLFFFCRY